MNLEPRILEIGKRLFARADTLSAFVNPWQRVQDILINLGDSSLKTELFRFVDVLPTLQNSRDIATHLREYLASVFPRIPKSLFTCFAPLIAGAARFGAGSMARRFIAAETADQAVRVIARLRKKKLAITMDLLGEAVITEHEAIAYQQHYLSLLSTLPGPLADLPANPLLDRDGTRMLPRLNLSLKLSSLFSQFDPIDPRATEQAVVQRLHPILRRARDTGAFIYLDMEQFAFKDVTLQIFQSVLMEDEFRGWPNVGIAIQAYLRSCQDDLRNLAGWAEWRGTPVWVRLVKGAYWDFETVIAAQNGWSVPVFTEKWETDANFEAATAFLIENRGHLRPAIASHNIRSIAAALAMAEQAGASKTEMEFQMLYGMAEPIQAALAEQGRRVRVYAPLGELLPGMAYLVRRLLENTSNESFLKAGFIEHVPQEQLLMNPLLKKSGVTVRPSISTGFVNESPADFSRESERRAMADALAAVSAQTPLERGAIIHGRSVHSGKWIESRNPSHKNRIVARCTAATVEMANQAIASAGEAFQSWRETPAETRARLLLDVADLMQRDRYRLSAIEVLECGKPWREADADVVEAIDFCRYYAHEFRKLSEPRGSNIPGETNRWIYEPRGVSIIIAPWNFPLAILTGMTAAAVVTGNTAIMKPAEQSSLIAAELAQFFQTAGAPPGVVNYLPGIGEEVGPTLINHPRTALIAFTGSRVVGLGINQQAAVTPPNQDHVKRVILEMGGKNAIIVDADADLDEAVQGVVQSAFGFSGQKCSACSRAIVLAPGYDLFLQRLIEATKSLALAPAEDPACRVGPVIDAEAYNRILAAIQAAKKTARLAHAGDPGPLVDEGFFIPPHIFADVALDSPLATEEIFGPVLAVLRAQNLDEAIALATSVPYALTGGIYSRSPANIETARQKFRVGNLYINRKTTGAIVGRQPFGGLKLSGAGTQAGGPDYLPNFMVPRCITENTLRRGFAAAE